MKCCFRSAGVSKDLASKHKRIQKHIGPFKAMFFFQRLVKNMCFLHLFKSPMKKIIKLLGCRSETCWKPVGHGFSRNQPLQDSLPPCPSRQRWMFLARVQRTDWETTLLGKSGKKKKSFYKQRFNKLSLCNRDKEAHTTVQFRQGHDVLSHKLFGVCFSSSDVSGDLLSQRTLRPV